MARWGKVNYRELQKLQKRMEKLEKADLEKFCEEAAKELAARLLSKVIKRTPVGKSNTDGLVKFTTADGKEVSFKTEKAKRTGGTLRRGWTAGKENMSEKGNAIGVNGKNGFAQSLEVVKKGDIYEVYVFNNTEYASYVEYGHRTPNHKGWVRGRFMMTISADEVDRQAPQILEKKLMKLLGDAFNGN